MKLSFKVIFIFSILFTTLACSEDENLPSRTGDNNSTEKSYYENKNSSNEVTNNNIEEVRSLEGEEQRLAYLMLTNNEKNQLWTEKLNFVLDSISLDTNQREHVEALKGILQPEFFDLNSEYRTQLYEDFMPDWGNEAQNIFEHLDIYNFFMNVDTQPRNPMGPEVGGGDSCSCNISEDFCLWWGFNCRNDGCEDTYAGCGILWNNTCNGNCI